jgi:hypothetical protein
MVDARLLISAPLCPFGNHGSKQVVGPIEIQYTQHTVQWDKKQRRICFVHGQLEENVQDRWVRVQASDDPTNIKEE